jgi:hypothetical protein
MAGRKPFAPTEEQRRIVRAMAGYGVPHDDIALVVKCSPPTLRRRFRHELDVAMIEANARVAQTLYQQATTPGTSPPLSSGSRPAPAGGKNNSWS